MDEFSIIEHPPNVTDILLHNSLGNAQVDAVAQEVIRLYEVENISTFCRDEWQYLIPTEPSARQQLRAICECALLFERHFLAYYKRYLLEQLHSTEQTYVRHALWIQEQIPLDDEEITTALQAVY